MFKYSFLVKLDSFYKHIDFSLIIFEKKLVWLQKKMFPGSKLFLFCIFLLNPCTCCQSKLCWMKYNSWQNNAASALGSWAEKCSSCALLIQCGQKDLMLTPPRSHAYPTHPPTLPPKTGTREEQPDPHYRTVGSSVFIEKSGSKVRNVKVARIKMKPFVPTWKKKKGK